MQTTKRVKAPRKQRKQLYNAPAHLRHKLMAAPLSPQLTASKTVKTLPVRKGDTVRIMRGDNKGFEGKISRVDLKNYRIYLEGLTREKVDGTAIFLPVHPSKVMIKNLNLNDKWRKAIVDRKEQLHKQEAKIEKAAEKATQKTAKTEKTPEKPREKPATAQKEPKKATEVKAVEAKEPAAKTTATAEEKPATAPAKTPKKTAAPKRKKEAAAAEEKPTAKDKKPKTAKTTKKTQTKSKTASKEKQGGD